MRQHAKFLPFLFSVRKIRPHRQDNDLRTPLPPLLRSCLPVSGIQKFKAILPLLSGNADYILCRKNTVFRYGPVSGNISSRIHFYRSVYRVDFTVLPLALYTDRGYITYISAYRRDRFYLTCRSSHCSGNILLY